MSSMNELRNVYQGIVEEYKQHQDSKLTERLIWKTFAPVDLDLAETLLERYKFDSAYKVENPTIRYEQMVKHRIKAGYLV